MGESQSVAKDLELLQHKQIALECHQQEKKRKNGDRERESNKTEAQRQTDKETGRQLIYRQSDRQADRQAS